MTKPCSVCGTACSLTCSCRQRSYCSQACLKADWRTHKTNCPKVEERHISQAKGRGLVATRNIKKGLLETNMSWISMTFHCLGSVVLEEAPLLLLKKVRDFEKKILEEHKKLTKSAKAKYGSLSSLARQDRKKVVNIWFSNAINTRVLSSDDDMEGVFYRVALINHSCSPNTVINITEDRKIKIVSVEDIKKGEEILLNYLKPTAGIGEEMLKFQRQKKLRSEFQFSCECRICSLSGQELQRNQHFKRELAALSASLPTLRDFNNVENLKFSLYLLSEINKYMKKLGSETIR